METTPCCAAAAENYNFGVGVEKAEQPAAATAEAPVETQQFGCGGGCGRQYAGGNPFIVGGGSSPKIAHRHRYRSDSPSSVKRGRSASPKPRRRRVTKKAPKRRRCVKPARARPMRKHKW